MLRTRCRALLPAGTVGLICSMSFVRAGFLGAAEAEQAFLFLAEYDDIRRRILIPVIKTEIRMRARRRHGQSVRLIPGLPATERNRERAGQKEAAHRQAIEHSWRRLKTSMASALVFFGKQMVFRAGYHPARETSRGPSHNPDNLSIFSVGGKCRLRPPESAKRSRAAKNFVLIPKTLSPHDSSFASMDTPGESCDPRSAPSL